MYFPVFVTKRNTMKNMGVMPTLYTRRLSKEFWERVIRYQLLPNDKVILILESRKALENQLILKKILSLLHGGTYFVNNNRFDKIDGAYFNPKRPTNDCYKSYLALEIADLISYPNI